MIYSYDTYRYIIIVNKNISLDIFLKKCGAKTGFAKNMFTHLYNSIFAESTNIVEEFDEYYKIEYNSLQNYLHRRYAVPKNKAKNIVKTKESNPNYTIISYDALSYGMENNDNFLFGEILYNRIMDILTKS